MKTLKIKNGRLILKRLNFKQVILVLGLALITLFTSCSSESTKTSDVEKISNIMNDNLILPPGAFTIDPATADVDETIQIVPKGNSNSIALTPGQSMTNNISFRAPNANVIAVGMRFGTSGPIHFVNTQGSQGNTSGTGSFKFQLPDGICDDLSRICHDIKCYEFASTAAGTISRANIVDIAMMCGKCDEPSCQSLLGESACTDPGGGTGTTASYPTLIAVAGGTFDMGGHDIAWNNQRPIHSVTLSNYSIGKTEVTVAQYRAYCTATGTSMPRIAPSWGWNDNDPMVKVDWNDAMAYCTWLSGKLNKTITLPTEAQWEFAARGGNQSNGYTYSGSNTLGTVGWYGGDNSNKSHEVAQKKANELGLYDMSGNVSEWCLDWYSRSYYSNSPNRNPQGPTTGNRKVQRGGNWVYNASFYCRVAHRNDSPPSYSLRHFGFRVVSL